MDSFGDKVAFVLAKTLICTLGPFAAIYVAAGEAAREFWFELKSGWGEYRRQCDSDSIRNELRKRKATR